jgi:ankyrin repeat protein
MRTILLVGIVLGIAPLVAMDHPGGYIKVKLEPGSQEEASAVERASAEAKRTALVLADERQGADRAGGVALASDNSRGMFDASQNGSSWIDLDEEPYASMGNGSSNKRGRSEEYFDLDALADLGAVKKERMDGEGGSVVQEEGNQIKPLFAWHKPYGGTVEELKQLLAETIYPVDGRGWTMLHSVVMAGNMPCLTYLLERLKNSFKQAIELQDEKGLRALHVAAAYGQQDCLEALLRAGGICDAVDKVGATPLVWVLANDNVACAEDLIKAGANINWRGGPKQLTFMHDAAYNGAHNSVKLLLAKGLAVDVVDKDGVTPLAYALAKDKVTCAEELIKAGAHINWRGGPKQQTLLHAAAAKGAHNSVKLLLAKGLAVDAVDKDRLTTLCYALARDKVACAEELIKAGARLDWRGQKKQGTLLHDAAYNGALNSVKFLIAKGLDPDAKNSEGKTPAMLASEKGHKECAEELAKASQDRKKTALKGKAYSGAGSYGGGGSIPPY